MTETNEIHNQHQDKGLASTALFQRLHQRLTTSAGVINTQQVHCHQTTANPIAQRLLQRLALPEQQQTRYQIGGFQPDGPSAALQRFQRREAIPVAATKNIWWQPADSAQAAEFAPGESNIWHTPAIAPPSTLPISQIIRLTPSATADNHPTPVQLRPDPQAVLAHGESGDRALPSTPNPSPAVGATFRVQRSALPLAAVTQQSAIVPDSTAASVAPQTSETDISGLPSSDPIAARFVFEPSVSPDLSPLSLQSANTGVPVNLQRSEAIPSTGQSLPLSVSSNIQDSSNHTYSTASPVNSHWQWDSLPVVQRSLLPPTFLATMTRTVSVAQSTLPAESVESAASYPRYPLTAVQRSPQVTQFSDGVIQASPLPLAAQSPLPFSEAVSAPPPLEIHTMSNPSSISRQENELSPPSAAESGGAIARSPIASPPATNAMNAADMVDQVSRILSRQLAVERERRGMGA